MPDNSSARRYDIMGRNTGFNEERIFVELLKEYYDKHRSIVDIMATSDNKTFKTMKRLCADENGKDMHTNSMALDIKQCT